MAALQLAQAQSAAKDYNSAIDTLNKVLAAQPEQVQASIGLAKIYVLSGHLEDALAEAHKLQKAHPDKALGFALEGEVLASQKNWPAAAGAYREALARQPVPLLAVRRYAALQNAGKASEAVEMADRWMKQQPK